MRTCIDGNLSGIHKHDKVVGVGKIVDYRKKYYFFHWP